MQGNPCFDWTTLGREVGVCFRAVPRRVRFLNGVLDGSVTQVVKQRKGRGRRQKKDDDVEEEKEERPEEVKDQQADPDRLSAVEKTMKEMKKILRDMAETSKAQAGTPDVDGLQFLFNPKSFTQTVENIFHFSFLVKKGQAGISVRTPLTESDGLAPGLYIRPLFQATDHPPSTQAVCSFTMRDFKQLCEAYEITKGCLENRKTSSKTR